LALRLRHRQSEDFDFFSNQPFDPTALRISVSYLKHAEMIQFQNRLKRAPLDGQPVRHHRGRQAGPHQGLRRDR